MSFFAAVQVGMDHECLSRSVLAVRLPLAIVSRTFAVRRHRSYRLRVPAPTKEQQAGRDRSTAWPLHPVCFCQDQQNVDPATIVGKDLGCSDRFFGTGSLAWLLPGLAICTWQPRAGCLLFECGPESWLSCLVGWPGGARGSCDMISWMLLPAGVSETCSFGCQCFLDLAPVVPTCGCP